MNNVKWDLEELVFCITNLITKMEELSKSNSKMDIVNVDMATLFNLLHWADFYHKIDGAGYEIVKKGGKQ